MEKFKSISLSTAEAYFSLGTLEPGRVPEIPETSVTYEQVFKDLGTLNKFRVFIPEELDPVMVQQPAGLLSVSSTHY